MVPAIFCQKKKICHFKRNDSGIWPGTGAGGRFPGGCGKGNQRGKRGQDFLDHYYSSCCPDEVFRQIYNGYQKALRQRRKLDFDDMLLCCYELFVKRKDILAAWQNKFQYIMVDEFQDINHLQYDIVRMLAKPRDNLFIVGDDDQSIYHFRGAKPGDHAELYQRLS